MSCITSFGSAASDSSASSHSSHSSDSFDSSVSSHSSVSFVSSVISACVTSFFIPSQIFPNTSAPRALTLAQIDTDEFPDFTKFPKSPWIYLEGGASGTVIRSKKAGSLKISGTLQVNANTANNLVNYRILKNGYIIYLSDVGRLAWPAISNEPPSKGFLDLVPISLSIDIREKDRIELDVFVGNIFPQLKSFATIGGAASLLTLELIE